MGPCKAWLQSMFQSGLWAHLIFNRERIHFLIPLVLEALSSLQAAELRAQFPAGNWPEVALVSCPLTLSLGNLTTWQLAL